MWRRRLISIGLVLFLMGALGGLSLLLRRMGVEFLFEIRTFWVPMAMGAICIVIALLLPRSGRE